MPNWTHNYVTIVGKDAEAVVNYVKGDRAVDFNKIIPMPDSIKNSPCMSGEYARDAEQYYGTMKARGHDPVQQWDKDGIPKHLKAKEIAYNKDREYYLAQEEKEDDVIGIVAMEKQAHSMTYSDMMRNYLVSIRDTGCVDWYWWCINNWGTKWNASEPVAEVLDGNKAVLEFHTAWSAPRSIFKALAEKFHDVTFEVEAYYEDGGKLFGKCYWNGTEAVLDLEESDEDEYEDEEEG